MTFQIGSNSDSSSLNSEYSNNFKSSRHFFKGSPHPIILEDIITIGHASVCLLECFFSLCMDFVLRAWNIVVWIQINSPLFFIASKLSLGALQNPGPEPPTSNKGEEKLPFNRLKP